VVFNEAKIMYKNLVDKSQLLLDSFYLGYEEENSFQSIRDEDNQSVRIDQSVRMRDENTGLENSENSDQDDLTEITSSAESLTEMQLVGGNLTLPQADSSQTVRFDQATPLHATENTLVVPANQDNGDEHTNDQFVSVSDSESNEVINHQTDDQADNRLISDENNSLILNYSRSKKRHDYK
jgi:hypothetical protein